MNVLVLSAVPEGLRGHVTRWLLEISPGVFVGRLSKRVRERLWDSVTANLKSGRAILVSSAQNEQGMQFLTHGDPWRPTDFEGLTLMVRPKSLGEFSREVNSSENVGTNSVGRRRPGMSRFERMRRGRRGFPKSDRNLG